MQEYKDLIASLRSRIKDLSITTDIIAGFPQETDEDFEETLNTVREIGLPIFMHSHTLFVRAHLQLLCRIKYLKL